MKKILLFFLSMFLCELAMAQKLDRVKITMKSGTVIKGKVLQSLDEEKAHVSLFEGHHMSIFYDDIANIKLGKYGKAKSKATYKFINENVPVVENSRVFHLLNIGGLIHTNGGNLSLQQVNGYYLKPWLGIGLGIGYDLYQSLHAVPIVVHARGLLNDKNVSPFYFIEGGYGHAWLRNNEPLNFSVDKVQGGFTWQAGMGYQINFSNTALTLQVGFKRQASQLDYEIFNNWWGGGSHEKIQEDRVLRRATFSIGFVL